MNLGLLIYAICYKMQYAIKNTLNRPIRIWNKEDEITTHLVQCNSIFLMDNNRKSQKNKTDYICKCHIVRFAVEKSHQVRVLYTWDYKLSEKWKKIWTEWPEQGKTHTTTDKRVVKIHLHSCKWDRVKNTTVSILFHFFFTLNYLLQLKLLFWHQYRNCSHSWLEKPPHI